MNYANISTEWSSSRCEREE